MKKNITFCLIAFVVILLICWFCIRGSPVEVYRDSHVRIGKMKNLASLLSPHSDQDYYLEIGGKRYSHVLGLPPCYLALKDSQRLLFVTENGSMEITFHLVDLLSMKSTKIFGGKLNFGGHIGSKRNPGEPNTDYVENESSKELILVSMYSHARLRIIINLVDHKVDRIEYDEFDEQQKVKTHKVHEGTL